VLPKVPQTRQLDLISFQPSLAIQLAASLRASPFKSHLFFLLSPFPPFEDSKFITFSCLSSCNALSASPNPTNKTPRTGCYKYLTIFATLSSALTYLLLILRWHGHTGILESLYIIPGGFGCGSTSPSPVLTSHLFPPHPESNPFVTLMISRPGA
jgi:hypothetical protein